MKVDNKLRGQGQLLDIFKTQPFQGGISLIKNSDEAGIRYGEFSKFFICVIDTANATRTDDDAKTGVEIQEDILEALGLSLADGERFQSIFAAYDRKEGYCVPQRMGLDTDADLRKYFSSFQPHGGDMEDSTATSLEPEVLEIRKELQPMRLGGLLTKIQMGRYCRHLNDQVKTVKRLTRENEEKISEMQEMVVKYEARIKEEIKETEERVTALKDKEAALAIEELTIDYNERVEKIEQQLKSARTAYSEVRKECMTYEKERDECQHKYNKIRVQMAVETMRANKIEKMHASSQKKSEKALLILKKHGMDVDEIEGTSEHNHEDGYFMFIPGARAKLGMEPERVVLGPETSLGELDKVQLEFYPGGVSTSSVDGWSALRIRLPSGVRVKWQVVVGVKNPITIGPRLDDYHESFWWCRKGILWHNFCQHDVLKDLIATKNDSLSLQLQVLSITKLTEKDLPPPSEPKLSWSGYKI